MKLPGKQVHVFYALKGMMRELRHPPLTRGAYQIRRGSSHQLEQTMHLKAAVAQTARRAEKIV